MRSPRLIISTRRKSRHEEKEMSIHLTNTTLAATALLVPSMGLARAEGVEFSSGGEKLVGVLYTPEG
jgi:hypothetical protein